MLQQTFRMKDTGESSASGGSIPPQYITVDNSSYDIKLLYEHQYGN